MKKLFLLVFLLLYFCIQNSYCQPIPDIFKSTVVFICEENKDNIHPIGTGFLVGVKDTIDIGYYSIYLVTAKHVLFDSDKLYDSLLIRVNTKSGKSDYVKWDLRSFKPIFHEDTTVDIAIIPFNIENAFNIFEIRYVSPEWIPRKDSLKSLNIGEGTNVFFIGLFTQYAGKQKNYPIIRSGKLALVTDEKIQIGKMEREVYLMETFTFGGNSGSPVFFSLNDPEHIFKVGWEIRLAGIISGYLHVENKIKGREEDIDLKSTENSGIAVVTPSYLLYEMLFYDEVVKARK
jgi:hypothetical protein